MKYVIWVTIAVAAVYFGRGLLGPSTPKAHEVEPLIRDFLETENGHCTVDHLSDVSVGKYTKEMGGWPVYASHEETCRQGSTSTTYQGRDDARKSVAVAFVRRTSGGALEVFVPPIFQQAQQEMQQALQSAVDNMK